jgi:hypothetical protein
MDGATSTYCDVSVMGAPLNPLVQASMIGVEVDSSMHVPSAFRLVFRGVPDDILLPGGLQIATLVNITTGMPPTPLLMNAEITSVEVEHAPDGTLTIVRGMDRSHRLMRGTATMAYPEVTASVVVEELLGLAGVPPGEIIPTTTTYPWLSQANVSAWVFIQQLAAMENYVAYANTEGLFNFCPMPPPEGGLPPVMTYFEPPFFTQLVMGQNLVRLRATVSGAEQVPGVTVTGYDPTSTPPLPIIGPAPALPSTAVSLDPATLPLVVAGEFEAPLFFDASTPFDDEGAAITRAESIASDIAGTLAEVEGECIGNPDVLAGQSISIGMAGQPFDGQYICTSARHVFEPASGGYTTWFTVGGYRDRSLFALSSGAGPPGATRPKIPGVVIGTVVNNMDPESSGQVKVLFPWLNASYVSAWARTVQIGAGKIGEGGGSAGFVWLPEVGDEVLVAFDRGHIDHPYVIGSLYNGLAKPEPAPSVEGVVANRRIASRTPHTIQFDDGPSALGITITTAPVEEPSNTVKLDAQEMKITINSLGQIEISAPVGVTISSEAQIQIQSQGELSLSGATISVASEGPLSLQGATVAIAGPEGSPAGSISVSGAEVSLGV